MPGVVGIAARSALTALFLLSLLVASAMAEVSFAKERVRLITASGRTHDLTVELATQPDQREQGLMYRRQMAPDHGMLFDFGETRPVMMWMKNTYLPLDMLFIRSDGSIARIAANTEPLSTRTIPSGEPVLAVLELNAGTASRMGIKPGDRVEHPIFKR
jgi:uncharacterized protein